MRKIIFSVIAIAFVSPFVYGEELVIHGVGMQWKPMVTFANTGDTLKFKGMIGHDTQTIAGLLPEGSSGWKSKLGAEGFGVVVEREGIYVFKCNPHIGAGMVGVVIVGEKNPPNNLEMIQTNLKNVKAGRNMVQRAIRKMNKALQRKKESG